MFHYISKKKIVLLTGDIVLMVASLYLSYAIRLGNNLNVFSVYTGASVFTVSVYCMLFYIADLYNFDYDFRSSSFIFRFFTTVVIATAFVGMIFYLFPNWKYGRGLFAITGFLIFALTLSWRFVILKIWEFLRKPVKLIIVGAGWAGKELYKVVNSRKRYDVIGFLDDDEQIVGTSVGGLKVIGDSSMLESLIREKAVNAVAVAITHDKSSQLIKRLIDAKFKGVMLYDMPALYEMVTEKIPILHVSDRWFEYADFYGVKINLYNMKIKWILDKISAFCGLVCLSPVMAAIAVLIKLDSRGPVLYKQERIGRDGALFSLIKFRSMKEGAEKHGALWADENDLRVTRMGRIIRFLRLDEIPQLWNVLRGEMSFIGPRPERPEFVNVLNQEIPFYSLRHSVKPGITGWAQVKYRYGASRDDTLEKLQYDLYYIKNMSLFLDILILFETIKVVLFGKGAR